MERRRDGVCEMMECHVMCEMIACHVMCETPEYQATPRSASLVLRPVFVRVHVRVSKDVRGATM